MQDDPIFALFSFGIAAYLFYMWIGDYAFYKAHKSFRKGSFEGATTVSSKYIYLGGILAILLLAIHTYVEKSLGVSQEQSSVAWWAIFSWIGAAFVEELIFRGYLVVKNRGTLILIISIIFFSLVFAAAHPFVWNYEIPEGASIFSGVWKIDFSVQPIISTLAIFECSLLFYFLRFMPCNPNRSLLPCIAAHFSYNSGVFLIKAVEGFVV